MENKNNVVSTAPTTEKAVSNDIIDLGNNKSLSKQELVFLLKQTFPTLTQNDYFYALSQCKSYGLDPRKKEIYFVSFAGKNGNSIASITSYEVYARELESAGYDFITEWKNDDDLAHPENLMIKAKVVYKNSGNVRYQTPWISIKEYAKMNYQKTELVGMWKQFPSLMLEKCVLVRCSRFVIGKNLGYTAEELYNAKQYGIDNQTPVAEKEYTEQEKKATYEVSKWYYKHRGMFFTRNTAKQCWEKFNAEWNKYCVEKELGQLNVYELGCKPELAEDFKKAVETQYGLFKVTQIELKPCEYVEDADTKEQVRQAVERCKQESEEQE